MVLPARIGTAQIGNSNIGVVYIPPPTPPSEFVPFAIEWGLPGERKFETGLDRGVLYVDGLDGVVWNGLTAVNLSPKGGEARPYYIDGVKYLNLPNTEELEATISALYSPEEFDLCDGAASFADGILAHQQPRVPFCFSFRTRQGNDLEPEASYKLHIVYNALASPTTRNYRSQSSDPEVEPLSWKITTKPIPFPGLQPTSHITIDSSKVSSIIMRKIESILYGSTLEDARVLMPDELLAIFATPFVLVTDNGDGSYTVEGPDDIVIDNGDGTFTVNYEGAVIIDADTFSLTST